MLLKSSKETYPLIPNWHAVYFPIRCLFRKNQVPIFLWLLSAGGKTKGTKTVNDHSIHFGTPKCTSGIPNISLDEFVLKNHIADINFIKIDTDGYEYEVLKGAEAVIVNYRPIVILEITLYTLQEKGISFDLINDFFNRLGYRLFDILTNIELNKVNYKIFIPENSGIDFCLLYTSPSPRD